MLNPAQLDGDLDQYIPTPGSLLTGKQPESILQERGPYLPSL